MSKQEMRAEAERLVREAMEKKIAVKRGDTRIDAKCGKCGAVNKVSFPAGQARAQYTCKDCGKVQTAI